MLTLQSLVPQEMEKKAVGWNLVNGHHIFKENYNLYICICICYDVGRMFQDEDVSERWHVSTKLDWVTP